MWSHILLYIQFLTSISLYKRPTSLRGVKEDVRLKRIHRFQYIFFLGLHTAYNKDFIIVEFVSIGQETKI